MKVRSSIHSWQKKEISLVYIVQTDFGALIKFYPMPIDGLAPRGEAAEA
jgi:hypothetical protein